MPATAALQHHLSSQTARMSFGFVGRLFVLHDLHWRCRRHGLLLQSGVVLVGLKNASEPPKFPYFKIRMCAAML